MKPIKNGNIEELTKKNLSRIWQGDFPHLKKISEEQFGYHFGLKLYQYAAGRHYDLLIDEEERNEITSVYRQVKGEESSKEKQFQRLLLGYNGIPVYLSAYRCGLSSKEANNIESTKERQKDTTHDHVIGVTLAGHYISENLDKRVKDNYKDMKLVETKINEMTKDWLKDHLWLWATCRITKKEHRYLSSKDIKQYSTMKQKKNLIHYNQAGIEVEAYR
tara:strand:- start:1235 stop:1891 length:657 start_codon:yes stop_codon:yes gene_type:complete